MKTKHPSLRRPTGLAFVLFCSALTASAHPGHSLTDAGISHLVTSPDHLLLLALGGVMISVAGRFVQRRLPRWAMHGAGALALMSAIVLLGIRS